MKAIVQRVTQASVSVDGTVVSNIGKGLCVLVGIGRNDAPKHSDWLVKKILNLRLFDGEDDKRWNKSVMDKQYEVLCVSQFTLHSILKGNKPDFHESMGPDQSKEFYERFLQQMKENYSEEKIKDGVFGAMMQVHIQNDGPVTIPLEAPDNLPDPKVRKWQSNSKKTQVKGNNSSDSLDATASQIKGNNSSDSLDAEATETSQGATGDS